jgi:hypothetical protein
MKKKRPKKAPLRRKRALRRRARRVYREFIPLHGRSPRSASATQIVASILRPGETLEEAKTRLRREAMDQHVLDSARYGATAPGTSQVDHGSIIADPGRVGHEPPPPEPVVRPWHEVAARQLMQKLDVWATLINVPGRDAYQECVREIAQLAARFEAAGGAPRKP